MADYGDSKNILVGAASVFLGDAGADVPAPDDGTSYRVTIGGDQEADTPVPAAEGWRNVGFTSDGFSVSTDPSYTDVEVDQLLDAPKIFKDGMGFSVSTSFAEATLENLLVAWGQPADSFDDGNDELFIEGGNLGEAPVERQLIAVGNGPQQEADAGINEYSERIYTLYRVLSVEGSEHSLARAEATTIPVTFRCLPKNNGRYGSVRDRVIGDATG